MVSVFSKPNFPRKEDLAAKKIIEDNWSSISRIADHLSGGRWSERQRPPAPAADTSEGRNPFVGYRPAARAATPRPYVRISPNDRIVVVDGDSNRQMLFVGELYGGGTTPRRVRLATRENGYFDPLSDDTRERLAALEGAIIAGPGDEEGLKRYIADRLGIAPAADG